MFVVSRNKMSAEEALQKIWYEEDNEDLLELIDDVNCFPLQETPEETSLDDDVDFEINNNLQSNRVSSRNEKSKSLKDVNSDSASFKNQLCCSVCLESFNKILNSGQKLKSTVCGHVFCQNCINLASTTSNKCPVCRKKIENDDIHTLYLSM